MLTNYDVKDDDARGTDKNRKTEDFKIFKLNFILNEKLQFFQSDWFFKSTCVSFASNKSTFN